MSAAGLVFAWGSNERGQLGLQASGVAQPRLVFALASVAVSKLATGDSHTLAITADGRSCRVSSDWILSGSTPS